MLQWMARYSTFISLKTQSPLWPHKTTRTPSLEVAPTTLAHKDLDKHWMKIPVTGTYLQFQIQVCFVINHPTSHLINCTHSQKCFSFYEFFFLWLWTLTYNFDHWIWPRLGWGEPARQISVQVSFSLNYRESKVPLNSNQPSSLNYRVSNRSAGTECYVVCMTVI